MPDKFLTTARKQRLRTVLEKRQPDLTLVLNNIHDPHNVSAILRSCDAFGVFGIHLYYTSESFPTLAQRTSASAKKWVEITRHSHAQSMFTALKAQNMQILSTGFGPQAKPLMEVDFTQPTAIVLGNEHRGVDPEIQAHVAHEIYIPMFGMVQSLNVSVAAAIILYTAMEQRYQAGQYDQSSFNEAYLEEMYALWCQRGRKF